MAVTSVLLTVAEFSRLPQPAGGVRQELHHGELFELSPEKKLHTRLRKRLVSLLEAKLNSADHVVLNECPFRPLPEYEVWVADVAVVSLARWEETPDDEFFYGVPAIVIEVLSPSNTASEMLDREAVCLRHGGQEFWLVDPKRQSVKVIRADGYSSVHAGSSVIEAKAVGISIAAHEIFAR